MAKATRQQREFKERRKLERKEAAQKRRAKQQCRLRGQTGHDSPVGPEFENDGNISGGNLKTNSRRRGKAKPSSTMISGLDAPEGFEPIDERTEDNPDQQDSLSLFYYYDTMCSGSTTLQYLQNGRTGLLFQKTECEALWEYRRIVSKSTTTSNLGGCIAQVYLQKKESWNGTSSLPLPWSEVNSLPLLLVIGLDTGFDCLEVQRERARNVLRAACTDRRRVVGLCAILDYSTDDCQDSQMARALVTSEVAVEAELPLQLRVFPGPMVANLECHEDSTSLYLQLLQDVHTILETHPSLKLHLCSWRGLADDMMTLIQKFPGRVWIGLDGSVTFAKALSSHKCAADIPLENLLLETGTNIPTPVATALGRQAFSHSGLIPYVAAGVAKHKGNSFSARQIARAASENAVGLYHLMNHTDTIKHWPRLGATS